MGDHQPTPREAEALRRAGGSAWAAGHPPTSSGKVEHVEQRAARRDAQHFAAFDRGAADRQIAELDATARREAALARPHLDAARQAAAEARRLKAEIARYEQWCIVAEATPARRAALAEVSGRRRR
jgi:hypothetical protein